MGTRKVVALNSALRERIFPKSASLWVMHLGSCAQSSLSYSSLEGGVQEITLINTDTQSEPHVFSQDVSVSLQQFLS